MTFLATVNCCSVWLHKSDWFYPQFMNFCSTIILAYLWKLPKRTLWPFMLLWLGCLYYFYKIQINNTIWFDLKRKPLPKWTDILCWSALFIVLYKNPLSHMVGVNISLPCHWTSACCVLNWRGRLQSLHKPFNLRILLQQLD